MKIQHKTSKDLPRKKQKLGAKTDKGEIKIQEENTNLTSHQLKISHSKKSIQNTSQDTEKYKATRDFYKISGKTFKIFALEINVESEISTIKGFISWGINNSEIIKNLKFLTQGRANDKLNYNLQYIACNMDSDNSKICRELGIIEDILDGAL